jgi:flagellar basal-body rod protein FlgG
MSIRALSTAVTGMQAQSTNVDVIANNLSNVNTTAFKKQKANFEDLLYQQIRSVGTTTPTGTRLPTGLQVGIGTRLVGIQRYFEQGSLDETRKKLDLAIQGEGFFQMRIDAAGTFGYTRAGAFTRSLDGILMDPNGRILEPQITIDPTIPEDNITISEDGRVEVLVPGQTAFSQVGQITLSRFPNPEGLRAMGQNLFVETDASGAPLTGNPGLQGLGVIRQGSLELSNVELVKELTDMIKAQRAYEINSESIKTADEMLQTAGNLRR